MRYAPALSIALFPHTLFTWCRPTSFPNSPNKCWVILCREYLVDFSAIFCYRLLLTVDCCLTYQISRSNLGEMELYLKENHRSIDSLMFEILSRRTIAYIPAKDAWRSFDGMKTWLGPYRCLHRLLCIVRPVGEWWNRRMVNEVTLPIANDISAPNWHLRIHTSIRLILCCVVKKHRKREWAKHRVAAFLRAAVWVRVDSLFLSSLRSLHIVTKTTQYTRRR